MMRSKVLAGLFVMMALFAYADRPHDIFNAHRERILSENITVIDDTAFIVGRAKSSAHRGDAVGWAKAESSAKWHLGDGFSKTTEWPSDATEEEKRAAWLEYRTMHPHRFRITGMQRVWSHKTSPDVYLLVLSIPVSCIDLNPPSKEDLIKALFAIRERRRIAKENAIRGAARLNAESEAEKTRAGYREESAGAVKQQQTDEDLIF